MPDERLARWLLRIYPRTWRDRYGDEFLALVADTGLTWRGALDIAAAASVERGRHLLALSRGTADLAATTYEPGPQTVGEWVLEGGARLLTLVLAVLLLGGFGVPPPSRMMWPVLPGILLLGDQGVPRPASAVDRVLISSGRLLFAVALVTVAWSLGRALRGLGIPQPPMALVAWVGASMVVVGAVRLACRYDDWLNRVFGPGSTSVARPHLWTGPLFLGLVLIFMADLEGDIIWMPSWVVYSCGNAIRLAELARRRASKVVNGDSPHL